MPWEAASQFVYTQDNHNSVLGIRNLARAANASSMAVTMQATQGTGSSCHMVLSHRTNAGHFANA